MTCLILTQQIANDECNAKNTIGYQLKLRRMIW